MLKIKSVPLPSLIYAHFLFSPVSATASGVSRLGLDDSAILMEENAACSLAEGSLKIVWVVNSENYIYKRNSLNRAKQVDLPLLAQVIMPKNVLVKTM